MTHSRWRYLLAAPPVAFALYAAGSSVWLWIDPATPGLRPLDVGLLTLPPALLAWFTLRASPGVLWVTGLALVVPSALLALWIVIFIPAIHENGPESTFDVLVSLVMAAAMVLGPIGAIRVGRAESRARREPQPSG